MKTKHIIITFVVLTISVASLFIFVHFSFKKAGDDKNVTIIEWKTYTDDKEKYSISYPGNLSILSTAGSSVSFSDAPNDPWFIAVQVSTTTFATTEQWLADQDKKYGSNSVIKKHVAIDDGDAIVTYQKDTAESFPNEKRVIFIKEGRIYEISTRYNVDEEKVWGSFHTLP